MPRINYGPSLGSLKDDIVVYQKNINNYKTDTKYVAEQQAKLDEAQKKVDAILEAAKKPFPGKASWEKKYPLNPAVLVKQRLQEYLQLAATVDFNAVLTAPDKYNIKKFVNPAFEKKSNKWKAIYRAGKEVNDVVTAFVKDWLKGDIISANKTKMTASTPTTSTNNTVVKPSTTPDKTSNSPTTKVEEPTANHTQSKTDSTKPKKSLLNKVKGKIGF